MSGAGVLTYEFTSGEVLALALLLRNHEDVLDSRLDSLKCILEDHVYQIMTIEEAEAFFK